MNKGKEVAKTLTDCLKHKKVFNFHNLYEESKKLEDTNVEDGPSQKMDDNEEEKKEKRMKIKINFKPYIPKLKKGNRRKQETEFKFYKKPSSPIKENVKAFIKLKDISLLTNSQKPSEVFDKEIIYLDDEEECYPNEECFTREPINYATEITGPDWNASNNDTEPLDLSVKCQSHYIPQITREELLPLDLSKPRKCFQLETIDELCQDIPPDRNSQNFIQLNTDEYAIENINIVHEFINPVEPPVSQIITFDRSSIIGTQVITLRPIQLIYTNSQVIQPGESQDQGIAKNHSPMTAESMIENPCSGKISTRKNSGNAKLPEDIPQNLQNCNIFSANLQCVAPKKYEQKAVAMSQIQDGIYNELSNSYETDELQTRTQKQSRKRKASKQHLKLKDKQSNHIPIKSQSINKQGMVKINEKRTTNGGFFCTFRNFTSSTVKTTRGKAADNMKRKSQ